MLKKSALLTLSQPNPLLCFFKHLPGPLVTRIILGIFQIWRVQLSRWKLSLCHNTGWPLVGNVGMKLYMVLMGDENSLIPHKGPARKKETDFTFQRKIPEEARLSHPVPILPCDSAFPHLGIYHLQNLLAVKASGMLSKCYINKKPSKSRSQQNWIGQKKSSTLNTSWGFFFEFSTCLFLVPKKHPEEKEGPTAQCKTTNRATATALQRRHDPFGGGFLAQKKHLIRKKKKQDCQTQETWQVFIVTLGLTANASLSSDHFGWKLS